jgi:hypothetical protein
MSEACVSGEVEGKCMRIIVGGTSYNSSLWRTKKIIEDIEVDLKQTVCDILRRMELMKIVSNSRGCYCLY